MTSIVGLFVAMLVACAPAVGGSGGPRMPPDVAARSNPNADTSKNPVLKRYEGSVSDREAHRMWGVFQPDGTSPGSHYTGCSGCLGCSAGDPSSLFPLLVVLLAWSRRSRARSRS